MSEWVKYDGTNPPTDTSKHVFLQFNNHVYAMRAGVWTEPAFHEYCFAVAAKPVRWCYLDPVEPEPEMPDVVWISGWNLSDGEGHWGREEIIPGSGRNRYRRCVEKEFGRSGHTGSEQWHCECGAWWDSTYGAFCPACGGEVKR